GRDSPPAAGWQLAVGDRSASPAVLSWRLGERQEVRLDPAAPRRGGGQGRGSVVPAQQALVEQHGMSVGEGTEVGAVRIGAGMVGDELYPGAGDRVVVLLRGPLVRSDALDPAADPGH